MNISLKLKLLGLALGLGASLALRAADAPVPVRLATDDDVFVADLGNALGYFAAEGIEIVPVKVESFQPDDYFLQAPLHQGQIDACVHWFQHTVFGARHNLPVTAVMVFNDAPGMTVLVANKVKDQIHSAADFKGRRVAKGAGYGTKSVITNYLARRAGLTPTDYTPVFLQNAGRLAAVVQGVHEDAVDVMTFQDPITAALLDTKLVTPLYDLTTRESTTKVLGATWPAQSLLLAPEYLAAHPDTVQHLVNAFVRTMRYVNTHTAEQIAAKLPASFFAGKDRDAAIRLIAWTLRTYAHGDYALDDASVRLETEVLTTSTYDDSIEGTWRAGIENPAPVDPESLYNNTFVTQAMQKYPASTAAAAPKNTGVSIWTQNVSQFRKDHGLIGGYTKRWDLSALPHYAPQPELKGTLRIWGNNYLKDGYLGEYWQQAFKKLQPGVTIEYHLPTAAMAVPALVCGVADLGMSNKAVLTDHLSFEQVYHYPLSEVAVATGSFDVYGWAPAFILAVNQDNPLTRISVKQLDGVFGGARSGGYVGSVWHGEYPYARGPEEDIRTWGQLGLTDDWASRPIHPGGQNIRAGASTVFSDRILMGSGQWVEGYRGFTNYITTGGKIVTWSSQAHDAIAKDRDSLFYISPLALGPGVRELAVQARDGGPFVPRTLETVHDHTYPLYNQQFFYFNRAPGKPVDPLVAAFLRFVLSQEGQDCIQREGRYLPFTADMVQAELKTLE
ncbi:MAG: ABC transporter substrate-binding protein [Opitutales bacterium]